MLVGGNSKGWMQLVVIFLNSYCSICGHLPYAIHAAPGVWLVSFCFSFGFVVAARRVAVAVPDLQ